MSGPSSQDILRVQGSIRVDTPDVQQINRTIVDYHESIVGKALATAAVLSGFDTTRVDPTTIQVSRADGAIILPEVGSGADTDYDSVHGAGVESSSLLVASGATVWALGLGGFAPGWLHVYVTAQFVAAKLNKRMFWNKDTQVEYSDTINTRYQISWLPVALPWNAPQPANSARISTINWDGALVDADIYPAKQLLFEGCAVPGGSAVDVPTPTPLSNTPLVDFNRGPDRSANGLTDLAQFANAALKCIEEIKDKNDPAWYQALPHGQSLRAAIGATYTIGTGQSGSRGSYNAVADPATPGYYDISPALLAINGDWFLNQAAVPYVSVLIKPGRYVVKSLALINFRGRLVGSGPATSLRFKAADAGKIILDIGSLQASSLDFEIADLLVETDRVAPNPCFEWYGRSVQSLTVRNVRLVDSTVAPDFPLLLAEVAQGAAGATTYRFDAIGAPRAAVTLERPAAIQISSSTMGHVRANGISTVLADRGSVTVLGSDLESLVYATDPTDLRVDGGRVGCLKVETVTAAMRALVRDVDLSGPVCESYGVPAVTQQYRARFLGNVGSGADLEFQGCRFGGTAVTGAGGIWAQNPRRFRAAGCSFVGRVAGVLGASAVTVTETGVEVAEVVDAHVEDFSQSCFVGAHIRGAHVLLTGADAGAVVSGYPSRLATVDGLTLDAKAATRTYLLVDVGPVRDSRFWVQKIEAVGGDWAIDTDNLTLERCEIRFLPDATVAANEALLRAGAQDAQLRLIDCDVYGPTQLAVADCSPTGHAKIVAIGSRIVGNLALRSSLTVANVGVVLEGVRSGRLDAEGCWESVLARGCVFALPGADDNKGARIFRKWAGGGQFGKICELDGCVLWARGDVIPENETGLTGLEANTFPECSFASSLIIDYETGFGGGYVPFDVIRVRGCDLAGVMTMGGIAGASPGPVQTVIVARGRREASVEACRIRGLALDTLVGADGFLILAANAVRVANNQIEIYGNVAGPLDIGPVLYTGDGDATIGSQSWSFVGNSVVLRDVVEQSTGLLEHVPDPAHVATSGLFVLVGNNIDVEMGGAGLKILAQIGAPAYAALGSASGNTWVDRAGLVSFADPAIDLATVFAGNATSP